MAPGNSDVGVGKSACAMEWYIASDELPGDAGGKGEIGWGPGPEVPSAEDYGGDYVGECW